MKYLIAVLLCTIATISIAHTNTTEDETVVTPLKKVEGVASFYSSHLDGTLTSTGERYRNNKMTAASNHFPLNTWVRVTNMRNDSQVIVLINDRMHPRMAKKGRVVDLSRSAAKKLNFMSRGLTKVLVEELSKDDVELLLAEQSESVSKN